jgi:precorrin-6A/cobalt-precorrin-6A reductase
MRVLILGGTTEASELARMLAGDARFAATLSLAGRTRSPLAQPIPCRIGGFGGVDGLAAYLRAHRTDALIDATHPFAAQMSRHAAAAAGRAGTPLCVVLRPEWRKLPGDRWHVVPDMQAAASALGAAPQRVLLTVGQKDLAPFAAAPQHQYLIRSVDQPPPSSLPPGAVVITARGPFAVADERRLMQENAIEALVTKNSGGDATRPKLDAARALDIPVVMVARPALPDDLAIVPTARAAMDWLEAHATTLRGE